MGVVTGDDVWTNGTPDASWTDGVYLMDSPFTAFTRIYLVCDGGVLLSGRPYTLRTTLRHVAADRSVLITDRHRSDRYRRAVMGLPIWVARTDYRRRKWYRWERLDV